NLQKCTLMPVSYFLSSSHPLEKKYVKNIFVDCSRKNFNKQRQALDLTLIQKKHTKRSFFNQAENGNYPGAGRYFYLSFFLTPYD
ncbi:hypothetical protein, partial [Klebsiella michiganensis]|uniref:hypothetical protein n=3 Tax=Klebsiella michiganensis TaxID=1134687 RepID=UPI0025A1C200